MRDFQLDIFPHIAAFRAESTRLWTRISDPFAFTLMELVLVIAIIGTLAAIATPLFSAYIDRAKVARAKADIRSLEKEILSFYIDKGRYPYDLSEIGLGGIRDPYGNPYQYQPSTYVDKHGMVRDSQHRRMDHNLVPVNTDFDLYSMGKDGQTQGPFTAPVSRDDIVRANNGQFVGLVSAY